MYGHILLVQICTNNDIRAVCRFLERGVLGGLVGDCGLLIPVVDPGFQVIGVVLKKFHKKFGVFCVKNQDFMKNIIFFQF